MRTIKILAISASLMLFPLFTQADNHTKNTLTILNWSEYLDPEIVKSFEQEYQAKVVEIYYASDQHRTEMLLQNDAEGYDLILSSGFDLTSYVNNGWLAKLEKDKLPILKDINPRWRSAFSKSEQYSVPYFWGTLGIVYRHDKIKEPITQWKQLFIPDTSLNGKIGMIGDHRSLIGMGLKSLGYSLNSEDGAQLNAVEKLLHNQKKLVKSYIYMTLDEKSPIVTGDIWVSMAYNGDALKLQEHTDNLTFVLPEEGGSIWVDYLTIGSKSENPDLAYAFINYINQPQIAAKLAQYVYCASPNMAAEKLLPQEFVNDEAIYPSSDSLQNSEFYQPLSARAHRKRNSISINLQ